MFYLCIKQVQNYQEEKASLVFNTLTQVHVVKRPVFKVTIKEEEKIFSVIEVSASGSVFMFVMP